ncbi:MAG: hypothetical protein M1829_002264 [Trizodia sp. TS-e1964]|nr:MAG: hypothetical protein M1829_002264 [Trizodia sp. TS-e1964]
MDSMRSLNKSLPSSPPKPRAPHPPEHLIQAFKSAALQVTQLYKTAATGEMRARNEGYQDALDDILTFLDKESLGLGDGEGWKVRQWATERLDGRKSSHTTATDSEDDIKMETEKTSRCGSPSLNRKKSQDTARSQAPVERSIVPPPTLSTTPAAQAQPPRAEAFIFRSLQHRYPAPSDTDMLSAEENPANTIEALPSTNTPSSSLKVDVMPRTPRGSNRHNHSTTRMSTRSTTSQGQSTATKRRQPFGDFFDIAGFGSGGGKEGYNYGNKRHRHT